MAWQQLREAFSFPAGGGLKYSSTRRVNSSAWRVRASKTPSSLAPASLAAAAGASFFLATAASGAGALVFLAAATFVAVRGGRGSVSNWRATGLSSTELRRIGRFPGGGGSDDTWGTNVRLIRDSRLLWLEPAVAPLLAVAPRWFAWLPCGVTADSAASHRFPDKLPALLAVFVAAGGFERADGCLLSFLLGVVALDCALASGALAGAALAAALAGAALDGAPRAGATGGRPKALPFNDARCFPGAPRRGSEPEEDDSLLEEPVYDE